MGYSRWDDNSYRTLAASTGRATMNTAQLFASKQMDPKLDPKNVKVGKGERAGMKLRESIISDENPNPTPIILALDVTGSMNSISGQISREELPKLMTAIHEKGIVSDPHVMFMGFDDVKAQGGHGALQVSYFEPDLRIVEQVSKIWLVNNGGGNDSESYDLPWYFAGRYTYLECFEKQGRKGYLFSFGDEPAPTSTVTRQELESIFGPDDYEDTKPAQSLKMAQEKFRVFHICFESSSRRMRKGWTDLLGPNALFMNRSDYTHLSDVVIATMAISEGADINEYIAAADPKLQPILKNAFSNTLQNDDF